MLAGFSLPGAMARGGGGGHHGGGSHHGGGHAARRSAPSHHSPMKHAAKKPTHHKYVAPKHAPQKRVRKNTSRRSTRPGGTWLGSTSRRRVRRSIPRPRSRVASASTTHRLGPVKQRPHLATKALKSTPIHKAALESRSHALHHVYWHHHGWHHAYWHHFWQHHPYWAWHHFWWHHAYWHHFWWHHGYYSGFGYARGGTLEQALRSAYALLAEADRDYDGHRAMAAHDLHTALGQLGFVHEDKVVEGKAPAATEKGRHEAQWRSDAQLRQAASILQGVQTANPRASAIIKAALSQIGTALSIN